MGEEYHVSWADFEGQRKQFNLVCDQRDVAEAKISELEQQLAQVQAEAAAMREALRDYGWWQTPDVSALWCSACGLEQEDGHSEECPIGKALSGGAGKDMLAKLAKLEAFATAIRDGYEAAPSLLSVKDVVEDALAALDEEGK